LEGKRLIALKKKMKCLADNVWSTPEASKLADFPNFSRYVIGFFSEELGMIFG